MKNKTTEKHWDIRPIKNIPALYRLVVGERSNGKTYGLDLDCIDDYLKTGAQTAYVRRWPDDIRKGKMMLKFSTICKNQEVTRLSDGVWNGVAYKDKAFWLIANDDGDNTVYDTQPFAFVFSISAMEHDKSIPYPGVRRIVFDEFISRRGYIQGEFMLFMNVISSIARERDDVDIWMLGNTVSKDCPYFAEMGLKHIMKQEAGTIDTYTYKKDGKEMLVAVERTANLAAKKSDRYFIFDNPQLEMITGGVWEMALYPHLFEKYKPEQIMFEFFVVYRGETIHCEVVDGDSGIFIFAHEKTTPLQENEDDLIFTTVQTNKPNHRMCITKPVLPVERKILEMIQLERMCFQDNSVGEVFNDYLKWCRGHSVIRA